MEIARRVNVRDVCPRDDLILLAKVGELRKTVTLKPMTADDLANFKHAAHVAMMCAECRMGATVVCDEVIRDGRLR